MLDLARGLKIPFRKECRFESDPGHQGLSVGALRSLPQPLSHRSRMPNPRTRRDGGGSCFTCDACGPPEKYDAVVCLRPQDSGKAVSRMPEVGCCAWLPFHRFDPPLAGSEVGRDSVGVGSEPPKNFRIRS